MAVRSLARIELNPAFEMDCHLTRSLTVRAITGAAHIAKY